MNKKTKEKLLFQEELQSWMKNTLNPYCLNECKVSCCEGEGSVEIYPGYEHLFQTNKINNKKIPIKKENSKGEGLFKSKITGNWHFEGGPCPNYDSKNKKCLIHNQYPRCALYPLMETETGYMLFSICSLHKMSNNEEPLKSLLTLLKKYNLKLEKQED